MAVQITSTTDSTEVVLAATGDVKPVEESTEVKQPEAVKADEKAEASDASENEADETDETELEAKEGQDDEEETSQDDETKPKKKGGFKKRIERFQKRLSEKEAEVEHWKQAALKSQPQPKPESKTADVKPVDKPKAESFETHDEYVEALTDWKMEQREKAQEIKSKEAQVRTEFQKTVDAFQAKVTEFKEENDDFDEVVADVDDIPLSFAIHDAIMTSDLGPQVMYELAKNRKELVRINGLSAIAAAREIGKLEARLSTKEETPKETKQTKAPPPLKPVGSGKSASVKKSIHDPNLGQKEFERLREEQEAQRG
jgi:hypothetical protein